MSQISEPHHAQNTDVGKLAKGASVSLVGRITGRATHIAGQVAIARLLGPETFGLYAIGWTVFSLAGLVSPLGLEKGVVRYASMYRDNNPSRLKGVIIQAFGITLLSSTLASVLLYFAAPWLAVSVFKKPDLLPVFLWLSPALVFCALLKILAATARVSQQMQYSVYTEDVAQPISNLFLFLLFYSLGWNLFGALGAIVCSFSLACFLGAYFVRKLFSTLFSRQTKAEGEGAELLSFSLSTAAGALATMSLVWVDRLLIGMFCSSSDAGIYQAASQTSLLFAVILGALGAIFSPLIAELHQKGEMQRLEELFRVSTKWGLYLSLPFFLVVCFAPQEVMTTVFGPGYESGAIPLMVLTLAQLINVGTGEVGYLLMMTGHHSRWFWLSCSMLLMNIVLNVLLIPKFGLQGAAVGTALTVVGLFLLGLYEVKRRLGIWPYDKRYRKGALATVVAASALWLFHLGGVRPVDGGLLLMFFVSIGVFTGALLLLGLDGEDRAVISLYRFGTRSRPHLGAMSR